jgi:hypothetical protein
MENTEEESKAQPADAQLTHTLNVRRVPHQVWTRARVNATLSNLAFRDFIIRLLEQSTPLITDSQSQEQKRTG